MTHKERLDLAGYAIIIACLFGVIALFGYAAHADAKRRLPVDDDRRYELMTTIDGQDYVIDEDLTRSDCMKMLHTVTEWTEGHTDYRCVRQPIAN